MVLDEDQAVVQAVLRGRTEAFRFLVDRHKGRLYSIVFKLVGDPDVAEELTQDCFVRAYTGLRGFRGEAQFGTWLVQIGLHTVRDYVRRRRSARRRGEVSLESLTGEGGESPVLADARPRSDPLTELGEKELRERVARALDRLPHEYREVLVLKHLEGLSYEEITRMTGDSVGSLKVRAHRARRLLREQFSLQGGEGPRIGLRIVPGGKEVGHEGAD